MAVFQAFFNSGTATYLPNDLVTGRVVLRLNHTATLRGIQLIFQGKSSVKWTVEKTVKDTNDNCRKVSVPYHSEELYFDQKFFIYGDAYAGNILHAGEYTFEFSMQLPLNLPTSFEEELGQVQYTMTVLSYPGIGNGTLTVPFRILNPLDLNSEPQFKNPISVSDEKTLCCWCCASNPLSCSLFIPASGFAIGKQIPITVDVDNLTSKRVTGVTVALKRVDTFIVLRPEKDTREVSHKIVELVLEEVPRRSSNTWERLITVPDGPPSGLRHCSIIKVRYYLKVTVLLPMPHHDLVIKAPITVGNIPIVGAVPPASSSFPTNNPDTVGWNTNAPPPPYNIAVAPTAPLLPVGPAPVLNSASPMQPQPNVVRDYHGRF